MHLFNRIGRVQPASEVKPSLQYVLISKVLCVIENKAYSEPHVSCALLIQIGPQLELKENASLESRSPLPCVHMHMIQINVHTHTHTLSPSGLLWQRTQGSRDRTLS